MDQLGPGRDLGFGRGGIAVARHVDDVEAVAAGEEDQLLRAARRVRGARQRLAAGERVDQARLADIGAAGEGDLDAAHRRQRRRRAGGGNEVPLAGEQPPAGLDFLTGEVGCVHGRHVAVPVATLKTWMRRHKAGHDAKTDAVSVYAAFFFANIALRLSNSSILAPCLRMMTLCCSTESVLFQAQ